MAGKEDKKNVSKEITIPGVTCCKSYCTNFNINIFFLNPAGQISIICVSHHYAEPFKVLNMKNVVWMFDRQTGVMSVDVNKSNKADIEATQVRIK